MASTQVFYKLNSTVCEVVSCSFSFDQAIDDKGMPASRVRGGEVLITVRSSEGDEALMNWAASDTKREDSVVEFMRNDQDSVESKLDIKGGYCVLFKQDFNALGAGTNSSALTTIKISANELTYRGATISKNWVS